MVSGGSVMGDATGSEYAYPRRAVKSAVGAACDPPAGSVILKRI